MNEAKIRDSIKTFLQKMRAVSDEIPEELASDALEMTEEVKDALEEEVKDEEIIEETEDEEEVEVKDEEPDIEQIVKDAVDKALRDAGCIKDEELEKLDELTKEITEEDEGEIESEEAVTIEPEKITDEETTKEIIADIKPIIAGMKDKRQKRILTDSIVKLAKMNRNTSDEYGKIMKAVKGNQMQMDSVKDSDYDYGMEIARKFNPHYMKEDK